MLCSAHPRGKRMTATKPAMTLKLGEPVRCKDGPLGELDDLVLNPELRRVTHLVVRLQGSTRARLVPIELADKSRPPDHAISLRCTTVDAKGFPVAHEVASLQLGQFPADEADSDLGAREIYPTPSYDAGAFVDYQPDPPPDVMMMYDRVPKGEVEIRRASTVSTRDGHPVGHVDALLVDDAQITYLVLRRRHFWRQMEVTVPIDAVERVGTDNVVVRLSKKQLKKLPAVPVRRSGRSL